MTKIPTKWTLGLLCFKLRQITKNPLENQEITNFPKKTQVLQKGPWKEDWPHISREGRTAARRAVRPSLLAMRPITWAARPVLLHRPAAPVGATCPLDGASWRQLSASCPESVPTGIDSAMRHTLPAGVGRMAHPEGPHGPSQGPHGPSKNPSTPINRWSRQR
jgi:hypothetical protein